MTWAEFKRAVDEQLALKDIPEETDIRYIDTGLPSGMPTVATEDGIDITITE